MGSAVSKLTSNSTIKTALLASLEPSMHATLLYAKNAESKEKAAKAAEDAKAATAAKQEELDAANAAAAETEAQQEAVRKKMSALGRLQTGYTFSDSNTGSTKVFS